MMINEEKMKMGTWILPQELHMEILSWLSTDSLLRFKSVCKAWYTLLLNDPGFGKSHLDRAIAAENHSLICESSKGEIYQLKAPYYTTATPLVTKDAYVSAIRTSLKLVGSCNGLLCFVKNGTSCMSWWYRDLVIMNPSTRRYRELPEDHNDEYYTMCPTYGFGYSSVLDDYKVVCISSFKDRDESTEANVYSMNTNSWKTARYSRYVKLLSSSSVEFLNEAFHWMGINNQDTIISFSISDDQFREVPAPPDCRIHEKRKSLMILRGCLCMMIVDLRDAPCDYEIWAMEVYGVQESWTRQFVISNDDHLSGYMHNVLMTLRNNDELLIRHGLGYLVLYDPKKKTARRMSTKVGNEYMNYLYWVNNCTYIASLVSLKSKVIYAGSSA